MKTKIASYKKPSPYESIVSRATARSYGIKRPKRKFNTYTKDEVTLLARNLKSQ
jgi:hypothetical protein